MKARNENLAEEDEIGGYVPTKYSYFAEWIDRKGRYVLREDLGAILEGKSVSTVHRQSAIRPVSHVGESGRQPPKDQCALIELGQKNPLCPDLQAITTSKLG